MSAYKTSLEARRQVGRVGLAAPSSGSGVLAGIPRAVAALPVGRTAANQDSESRDGRRAFVLTQASGWNRRPATIGRRFVLVECALRLCGQIQRQTHRGGRRPGPGKRSLRGKRGAAIGNRTARQTASLMVGTIRRRVVLGCQTRKGIR